MQDFNFARDGQIAQAARADRCPYLVQCQPWLVGYSDEFFTFALIRFGHDSGGEFETVLLESAGQGVLDRCEANHFTAHLGEALESAKNEDEPVGINPRDVSSVVPAAQRLKLRIRLGVQIAAHDVRAADEQASGLPVSRRPAGGGRMLVQERGFWVLNFRMSLLPSAATGVGDPFDGLEFVFNAWQQLSDGAMARVHRKVHAEGGAALSDAVAF